MKSTDCYNSDRLYRTRYNPLLRRSMQRQVAKRKNAKKSRHGQKHLPIFFLACAIMMIAGCAFGVILSNNDASPSALASSDHSVDQAVISNDTVTQNLSFDNRGNSTKQSISSNGVVALRPKPTYNKTIGFVGDSLTYGCCTNDTPAPTIEVKLLGNGYSAINRGVNGATTSDWLDKLLEPSLKVFRDNDVEVVQLMLGTNDTARGIPADQTVRNIQTIVDRLRANGAQLVVVNRIPFSAFHDDAKIRAVNTAISNATISGAVLGDGESYDYFRNHQDQLADKIHMTAKGYEKLAELWATAMHKALDD